MRKILLVLFFLSSWAMSYAQLTQGSIAFVGFNADGFDDFSIVALKEIPANTTINFREDEWDGTIFVDGAEGAMTWNSGGSPIAAGTVISFNNTSATVAPLPSVSVGTIGGELVNLNASDEVFYCYLGTIDVPTTFLTAIANGGYSAVNGTLINTSLTVGVNAINLATLDDDLDIAAFNGSRNNQLSFAAYAAIINTPSNWIFQDASGNQHTDLTAPDVPFSTTAFEIFGVAGDLAFTGLNAENNDDFSLVALKEIPANTTVYFRDDEWNGSALGSGGAFVDALESSFSWNTGVLAIPGGTIISFTNIGNTGLAAVSVGTVTYINTANTGIGGNDEAIFCYLGSDVNTPTVMLTAIGKGVNAFGTSGLNGTGLTEGIEAIYFTLGVDIAAYNGARLGFTASGFKSVINTATNWITEDGSGDHYNNSTQPDTPFSTAGFTFGATDTTPPNVTSAAVVNSTSIEVIFNESVTTVTAQNLTNYTISGGATITSISYADAAKKATLTTSVLADGTSYVVTVNNIADQSANIMSTAFTSSALIFNNTTPPLIITEIMYNALNIPEADALEFIEIYNNSANVVQAGGLRIKDANNFNFTLPETAIPANGFLLLATDKAGAEAFYTGKTFLDLPVIGNVLGNGGELIQLLNSTNTVVDEVEYDDAAPWPLDADERGYSLELFNLTLNNNAGQNWGVPSTLVKKLNGVDIFATPGTFTATPTPIAFAADKTNTTETGGTLSIAVNIAFTSTSAVSSQVTVVGGTAVAGTDYTFTNQTVTFPANSTTPQNISLQILDNTTASQDKYLVLQLGSVTNGSLGSIKQHIVFIKDNDRTPIIPSNALNLTYTGNFKVPESGSSAEISAFDPGSDRLFVVNSLLNKMEILNFANPAAITRISTIDMALYGAGLNSIAVKNGIVAVAIENLTTNNGKIAFFDTNGVHLKSVDAGNLPDMVTFTPDGKFVLTANEAQPIFYTPTLSDPEGSVTLVDLSSVNAPADVANITQANVTQINFNAFDGQMAALKSQGVRIFGPGSSVSQDLEPEYITVSADSKKAWVTLQENNAIAIIDLVTKTVAEIKPLGFKDHSLPENSFDASDVSGDIFFGSWKVKGMYMPDAIASYEVGGVPYVITANEGDAREYTGITDEVTFSSLNLDPTAFPDASVLKNNSALGRLAVTNKTGDTDNDGDFDEVYAFGARSFTIWNGNTGARVFDSGNQLERITAEDPTWGPFFNANNSTGTPARKNRSDNKGPEPEGVAVAEINGKQYAFVALERIGGVVTYDVTNPAAPIFVGYNNKRSNPPVASDDLGSEGIIFISAADSPTGNALVVLSNEVSGTISVYSIAVNPTAVLTTTPAIAIGSEAASTVITLTATASAPVVGDQTLALNVFGAGVTASDYTLSSPTITILNGATTGTATLTIQNDANLEGSETFSVSLGANSAAIGLGATPKRDIFVFDNDFPAAPAPNNEIQLSFVSSYLNVGPNPGNSAEISAYDPTSKRLFIVNSLGRKMNIVDFSDPLAMSNIATIDIAPFGGINSVAVRNGIVAVAIETTNLTDAGSVLFFDKDGALLKQVTVGSMPDMLTFSPNGNLVLTADEGEPSDAYDIDPEGTVSIIDISGGIANLTQANVTKVNFNSYDAELAALRTQGIRIYGPNATVSKDFEPEYIAFSADGNTAYVTLQENNAIAVLDIATKAFTAIRPLGLKDHSLLKNGLDASDNPGGLANVNITNLPIKGMYQPDAIAGFSVGGINYLVTANEGDSRVYPRAGSTVGPEGSIYNEEIQVGNTGYVLDPTAFPSATLLKNNPILGKLTVTNKTGNVDGDGDFDEIHVLGARSFSIWKPTATGLEQVFDSGDQFERITLANTTYGSIFNANHSGVTPKNRSDNKGPEPEGVSIATLDGKTYALIALERIGGVMVYNVTDPVNPVFVQWVNSRSVTTAGVGDLGSEGIFFIKAEDSPTGVPLVVVSNEVSSTISVYSVGGGTVPSAAPTALTAEAINTPAAINLSWTDNATNETGYQVQRSTSASSGFVAIGAVAANATTFSDNAILTNTTYYYKVIAFNDFGVSAASNTSNALIVSAPIASAALSITSNGFTANWGAVTGATGYQLDVSSDNFTTFVTGYNSKAISGASESITGLAASITYQYRVRAVNGAVVSLPSNVVTATTLKQSQTISFTALTDKVVGDQAFALAATSTSGLAVTFSTASDKVTLSGSQVTIVKAGRAIITANQAGNSTFLAAAPVERSFCIKPAKPTVTLTNVNTETPTLTSNATTGNQWFLNGNAISGATNATLNATAAGVYKVNVKVDDCTSDFSADVTLIVTGDLPTNSPTISAYPNPVEDYLQIQGISEIQESRLMDISGKERKIILEKNLDGYRANVQDLPSGMYVLRLNGATGVYQLKFVKK